LLCISEYVVGIAWDNKRKLYKLIHEPKIRHTQKPQSETVLVMQGGGPLGAYECGVFKTLTTHGIKFDIVAGSSIGAINAGIVAGSRSSHPERSILRLFGWMSQIP
jgi:NTE family protein